MNRRSQTLSANDQLKRLCALFAQAKSELGFIELCTGDMGIGQAEPVLFYKLLGELKND
jgi:hypothetical protein